MKTALARRVHAMWQRKGWGSTLLLPLAGLTGLVVAARARQARNTAAAPVPVIVVGNLVVGGTGKTPVVIALAQALRERGWHPGIISRGYGVVPATRPRTGQGTLDPALFGDEPALMAQATGAPVAVHPRRALALATLLQDYPDTDIVLSDDGLQHAALPRDIEIVVQDARGTGNGRLLPAGPLREPASRLARADWVISHLAAGQPAPPAPAGAARHSTMTLLPVAARHVAGDTLQDWPAWLDEHRNTRLAAVAAIGQPERFFGMLRASGLVLDAALALPDHDAYTRNPYAALPQDIVLVTEKDAVKCARFGDPRVWSVQVRPVFSDPALFDDIAALAAQRRRKRDHT